MHDPYRTLLLFILALPLAGRASPDTPDTLIPSAPGETRMEQRLDDIERRLRILEMRQMETEPYRTREEIQAHIDRLEAERTRLLLIYTDQFPQVRDIERKLALLREKLRNLEP